MTRTASSSQHSTLAQAIDWSPLIVTPDLPVIEVLKYMSQAESPPDQAAEGRASQPARYVLVMEQTELLGMFTETDLVPLVAAGSRLDTIRIAEVMTAVASPLNWAEKQDAVTVLHRFRQQQIRYLPVVDEYQHLLGVILLENLVAVLPPLAEREGGCRAADAFVTDAVDAVQAAICRLRLFADRSWHVDYYSAGCERIYGYTREELLAEPDLWQSRVLPADLDTVVWPGLERLSQEQFVAIEYRFLHPDGRWRWILETLSAQPETAADGWVITLIATDISDRKQAEDFLRQYERIIAATPDKIALINRDYTYRLVNQTYLTVMNKRGDEVIGHSIAELMGEAGFETMIKPKFDRCLSGETVHYEGWFHYPAIGLQFASVTYAPYIEPDGAISGVVACTRFLTELKQFEQALQHSETKLQDILNTASVSIANLHFYSNGDWETNYQSKGCEPVFSYAPEELTGALWRSRVHPDDLAPVLEQAKAAITAGHAITLDYRFYHQDGSLRWISDTLTPRWDQAARHWVVTAIAIDITDRKRVEAERKRAEEVLRESEARFQALATNIPGIVYRYFPGSTGPGRFMYISPGVSQLFEVAPEAVLQNANRLWQLIHPEDRQSFHTSVAAAVQTLADWQWEGRIITPSGQLKWIQGKSRVVTTETGDRVWDGLLMDITDRKRAEEAARQQAQQEQLLRTITQRIRQSLDLDQILGTTVVEVQRTLQADRTLILRLHRDGSGQVIKEAVAPGYPVTHERQWSDECFPKQFHQVYQQGQPRIITAIQGQETCLVKLMQALGVKSKAVAPIVQTVEDASLRIWGLLIVHACSYDRQWQLAEAEFLQQISNQLAIAIQQANLYQRLQTELTERQHIEAALRRSETRFRTIFSHAPIGVALTTIDGQMVQVNQALAQMLGYSEPELKTLKLETIVYAADLAPTLDLNQQLFERQISRYHIEKRLLKRTGEVVWVSLTAGLLQEPNSDVVYGLGMFENITERRVVEQMKDHFVSVVSHELRTPLSSILASLGLLTTGRLEQLEPEAEELLHIAVAESQRLVRLVNQILDLERLKSGHMPLMKDRCQVSELIARSVDGLRPLAQESEITVEVTAISDCVWVDSDRIIQTLTNLLNNAIKFSPPGTTVSIRAERVEFEEVLRSREAAELQHPKSRTASPFPGSPLRIGDSSYAALSKSYILFTVQDQGLGIPTDKLDLIFEPFEQIDGTDSRQRGSGLGLAICRSIIEQHGGQIWVTSIVNQGSSFFFALPGETGRTGYST